jgi:endonuclease YncB( thermonuclease family)
VNLTTAPGGHSIEPKALTIIGLAASGKTYDGTTAVNVAGSPAYDGLVNSESFPVLGQVTWAFADKNVGTNKTLVRTGNFEAPSTNYTVTTQPSLTAGIAAKELTVNGATVTTKTYNNTVAASITGATLVGVVDGDTVTVSGAGTFNDANAGESKPVTSNLVLGGVDAANYTLTQPSLTGTITKADQTITFAELPAKNLGDAPFNLSGTTTSGLTLSYSSSKPAVASVSGSTVTILSVGTTTVTATQSGNSNYNAATPVARTLTVTSAPTLIAGWDFQTTTNGGTAVTTNNAPVLYQANFGSGSLHLDGTQGSSPWIVSTNSTTNQVTGFGGTTINAGTGFSTNTASPSALALLGGASNSANGNSLVFKFDMSGRKDLGVSYATRGTSSGFTTHTWSISTNGSNWTDVSVQTGRTNSNFTAITLPAITNADNAANAYLRLTVTGATSSSGNNRLDNIQLAASTIVPSDTTAPVITMFGDNPLTLPVGATFTDPGATALDNIDGAVDVAASGEVNTAVPGSYTITYTATDAVSNTATATRTVNVIDVTAPVLTVTGDNPLYLPVGATFVEPGVSALDAIDGVVEVQTSGTVDTATRGTYILTYTATDAAGNSGTATRDVIVRSGATHMLETQYGLSGTDAGLAADADQDGVPNLLEYALGTDPTSGTNAPRAPELVFTGDAVRFSAVVRDNDNALRITPIITSDLRAAWSNTTATEVATLEQKNIPDGFRRRTWEVPGADAAALFIRFEVSYE